MKKSIIVLLMVMVLVTCVSYVIAEVLRNPICPECGAMMRKYTYADEDDIQLGVWTEERWHNDHEDYRYVWRETSEYRCTECCMVQPLGKVYRYTEWVCDPDYPHNIM